LLAEHPWVVEALAAIQTTDRGHLLLGELEVQKVEVFPEPLRVLRLGDHRGTALHAPSQNDLSGCALYVVGYSLGFLKFVFTLLKRIVNPGPIESMDKPFE
jgi:hypothetical protein